jgi:hypothetical protein
MFGASFSKEKSLTIDKIDTFFSLQGMSFIFDLRREKIFDNLKMHAIL